jgi:hypothetical protein
MVKITCGIGDADANVLRLKVWKVCEDFLLLGAASKHIKHILNTDAHPTNARASAALIRVDRNPLQFAHARRLAHRMNAAKVCV